MDDHSRFLSRLDCQCLLPGARVARFLEDFSLRVGLPEEIILCNGPEGTSKAMFEWSKRAGVRLRLIEPSKLLQNAFVECSTTSPLMSTGTFMGSLPDTTHAKKNWRWRHNYNTRCLHSALGYLLPTEFVMSTSASALVSFAVSTLPLNTAKQPEDSRSNRP